MKHVLHNSREGAHVLAPRPLYTSLTVLTSLTYLLLSLLPKATSLMQPHSFLENRVAVLLERDYCISVSIWVIPVNLLTYSQRLHTRPMRSCVFLYCLYLDHIPKASLSQPLKYLKLILQPGATVAGRNEGDLLVGQIFLVI